MGRIANRDASAVDGTLRPLLRRGSPSRPDSLQSRNVEGLPDAGGVVVRAQASRGDDANRHALSGSNAVGPNASRTDVATHTVVLVLHASDSAARPRPYWNVIDVGNARLGATNWPRPDGCTAGR